MLIEDAVAGLVDKALMSRRKVGIVTGIAGTRVVVSVAGGSLTLPRLASYSPTVGDTVHIDATLSGAWLVLGVTA